MEKILVNMNRRDRDNPILVHVRILETRWLFGRKESLVSPVNGKGSLWVTESKIITEGR